ncbi:MAG: hypothetical protein JSR84_01065 [Proteobacteria bacterium]|nr:hypothetical protein [Pseudomonadota bacterium]
MRRARFNPLQLTLGDRVISVDEANQRLTDALIVRVDAHDRRCRDEPAMSVHEYLVALEWVRWVEDTLEPIRRAAGFNFSRAAERSSAHTEDFYIGEAGRRSWQEAI